MNVIEVTAQPSLVKMQVRVDLKGQAPPPGWDDAVAEAIDFFVYERCECGFDIEDHIVTVGPFEKPFLYCKKGDDR